MASRILKIGTFLRNNTYKIEKVLGQGGFGITYLAKDLSLDRVVAIKEFFAINCCNRDVSVSNNIIHGSDENKEIIIALKNKFLKEAKNIAKLDHPNITKIYTAFEENNTAYYVMDYIEGETLLDLVEKNNKLSITATIEYLSAIGAALDYIHSRHINHLDVKPSNIMIRKVDNRPLLIDFGLSKQYDSEGVQTSTSPSGISHGYAPIEQYRPGGVREFSPQTDIYALAATFYYAVSGVRPPQAADLIDDGVSFPDGFPKGAINAINRAMSSTRKNRQSSVCEFLEDVRQGCSDELQKERTLDMIKNHQPRELQPKSRIKLLLIIIIILLIGTIVILIMRLEANEERPVRDEVELEDKTIPNPDQSLSISPSDAPTDVEVNVSDVDASQNEESKKEEEPHEDDLIIIPEKEPQPEHVDSNSLIQEPKQVVKQLIMTTVSPLLTNILYAGVDNPIDINVSGVPQKDIAATITNGNLVRKGNNWYVRPSGVGKTAVLTVKANIDGVETVVSEMEFRTIKLPDPVAYIPYKDQNGNLLKYSGGKAFSKKDLLLADGLKASMTDGILNVDFTIKSFQTIFYDRDGNAMVEYSDGNKFSTRQQERFKNHLSRGYRFYISNIKAVGEDGITRDLPPIEVIVG